MAHFASKRFTYGAQFGILLAFVGVGMIIGTIASVIPLLSKISFSDIKSGSDNFLEKLMVPENANIIRWMQFLTTLFVFFLPPVLYAWLCHKKVIPHLGLNKNIDVKQASLTIVIILAAVPMVIILQQITEMLPWSKSMLQQFKDAEITYNKQVSVIATMNNFSDYIISIVMIALLPAVFEEVLFRGALQNLLSRWFKAPIVALIVASVIFSAIHGSYLGFLGRAVLGFVLGWIYYRTGNLWLSIIGHFLNNALGVTLLYAMSEPGKPLDPSSIANDSMPLWVGALSIAAVYGLLVLFEKVSKKDIYKPGEEIVIQDESNLFASINTIGNTTDANTTPQS